ncbi:FUSC family protein [Streptomyces acidicola]|uniref:FUSC family protein n=1 Tax=Streptomyces acidicola TaxID=2596892 RepID=UPI003446720B
MPATSHGILRRLKAAFNRHLREAQQATSDLPADDGGSVRRLRRRLQQLHTSALLLQEFLYEAPVGLLRDTTAELERTARADAAAQRLAVAAIHASKDSTASSADMAREAETVGHLLQSGRRLIGTVAGVPFGYGLAVLAAGHPPTVTLTLLLACVFGMFYTPSGSYWAVTFFITGSLSMVLALLHTLSPELLALRVQETVLGAGCGILAAVLVVPTSVRAVAETRLRELLVVLDHLGHCAPQAGAPKPAPDARDLDQALEAFRKACRPLVHPLNPRRAERARVRRVLERVEATSFHARNLATETGRPRDAQGGPRPTRSCGRSQAVTRGSRSA